MIIDKMTNNYYRVLSFMYDHRVKVCDEYMVPFTQAEVSDMTETNKVSVNKFFKEYVEDGLLSKRGGKYYLTPIALSVMKKMKSIKD